MGHSRLGGLPRTRKWQQVVSLIENGASVSQIANATMRAAEKGFLSACNEIGVADSVWMLMQLPLAARSKDWVSSLKKIGVDINKAPTLMELTAKVTQAIDTKLSRVSQRSDLGEMAQNVLAETIVQKVGGKLPSLFSPTSEDVQEAFSNFYTVKNFSELSRDYFARLSNKYMDYFLSKTLETQVGEGRRFATLSQVSNFREALSTHCHEAAKIVERFSGEWYSKTNWQQGGVPKSEVDKFTFGAMSKLTAEFKEGAKENA